MTDEGSRWFATRISRLVAGGAARRLRGPDRVAFGMEPEAQVEAVAAGEADLAFDAYASERLEDLFVQFPAQVHTSPQASPSSRCSIPASLLQRRRRATGDELRDRPGADREIIGGEDAARATCQQLPPNFPGYEPYCPYTLNPGPGGRVVGRARHGEGSEARPSLRHGRVPVVVKIPAFFS